MLPIDIVKSGKAVTQTFDKSGPLDMEGFFQVLIGGYPQKDGIKTFEIQYADKALNSDLMSKQNGLPASVFVEINWNDNTIRTFFSTQPTIGDGFYQDRRTPFYTFSKSVANPAGPTYGHNGIEHYDYPAVKQGRDAGAFLEGIIKMENTNRPYTHEPRHGQEGAFAEWIRLAHSQEQSHPKIGHDDWGFEVFHIDKVNFWESHILNWKQGIKWMYNL